MVKFYIFILILPGKTGREEPIGNRHDTPINNKGLTKDDIGHTFLILCQIEYKIRINQKNCNINYLPLRHPRPVVQPNQIKIS